MRPELSQQNIAWFKFAELVSRREKERAMSIFRLLSLSWHDLGYTYLLKGDLLVAFNDESASEAYRKAIVYYDDSGRLAEAAHALERIVQLEHANVDALREVIIRHARLGNYSHVKRYGIRFKERMGYDAASHSVQDLLRSLIIEHAPEAIGMIVALKW